MEGVSIEKMEDAAVVLSKLGIQYGLKLLLAIGILVVGFWLVNKIVKSFRKLMHARQVEPSLLSFLSSLISATLKILVVVIVLTTVGVEMTSIVAILGAMSLAVGMALSGTLQNFAGGVVILLFKPFKVGDFVETQSGYSGTVQSISIFTTALKTAENKIVYLPNGALSNGVITNVNEEGKRRIDCTFGIAYGDDVNKARQILMDLLDNDERVYKTPLPIVYLTSLADSSVNVLVRFWANSGDVFALQCDLNEKVYEEFTRQGLNFPFPQMDVHLSKQSVTGE
jgi:small conductance mechanosensitive channel